jgi:hypothetical protein
MMGLNNLYTKQETRTNTMTATFTPISAQLQADVAAGKRTQWPYDLSGVKYKPKSDLIRLETQWNTFERVENINFGIYLRFLAGDFSRTWYQFVTNEEASNYRVGQQLHTNRYPNVPPATFTSISLAPLPICTNGSGPAIYGQVPRSVVSVPAVTEQQKTESNQDLAIYTQISTFNVLHSTFTYQFTSYEEQMSYYRAERRICATQQAAANPRPVVGSFGP